MIKQSSDGKIVLAYIEGDQETLREALKQFGSAVGGRMAPQTTTLIAVPVNHEKLNGGASGGDQANGGTKLFEVKPPAETKTEEATVVTPKAKAPRRTQKVPDMLPDEDLTSAEMPFTEYAKKLNPDTQFGKYLVIAAWFKRYKALNEITIQHIYNGYQLMKWQCPDDLAVPFRDMKRLHGYFSKGKEPKSWAITLPGSNEVDKLSPKPAE